VSVAERIDHPPEVVRSAVFTRRDEAPVQQGDRGFGT
jgi:hypothetical protein